MDMEDSIGSVFAKRYNVRSYPSLIYLDSDGKVVHRVFGARNTDQFIALGKEALNPKERLSAVLEKYRKGERDPEFIRGFLSKTRSAGIETDDVANWYFSSINDSLFTTSENFTMLQNFVTSIDQPAFQRFYDNKETFIGLTDPARLEDLIAKLCGNLGMQAFKEENVEGSAIWSVNEKFFSTAKKRVSSFEFEKKERVLTFLDARRLYILKDWDKYAETLIRLVDINPTPTWQFLNQKAWVFYEEVGITDVEYVDAALEWVKSSIEMDANQYNIDTYAALLLKSGDLKQAKKQAKRAIQLSEEAGVQATATKELLGKIDMAKFLTDKK